MDERQKENYKEPRLTRWLSNLQEDVKGILWFSALLMLFRIAFIVLFREQVPDSIGLGTYGEALWLGFRISLKTVGVVVLLGFVCATLGQLLYSKWNASKVRRFIYGVSTMVFTVLFFCRIPYYSIFNATFNAMIINGVHDDVWATLQTGIAEYGLLYRLPAAIIGGLVLWYCMDRYMKLPTYMIQVKAPWKRRSLWVLTALLIGVVGLYMRFGGAFTYAKSIHWENAARLQSNLLNEAVLDDGQALKRVHAIYERSKIQKDIKFSAAQLREKITRLGGNGDAKTIDDAFIHTIEETRLREQPNTVVFVLGESYGLWPFLTAYEDIGSYVAEEGKALAREGASLEMLLAHGSGTMPAVNGYLTGLPDVGLYPNYEGVSYKEPYKSGIGHIMKQLGYKTMFWYGGFGTWQDVERFAKAQGFDEFKGANDFSYKGGNAWGAPDGDLYKALEDYMEAHKGEKIFYFILTSSNHPPYDVRLDEAGVDWSKIRGIGNDTIGKNKKTEIELGHFWYADYTMGNFVRHVTKIDETTVFFVTGDHSERFSFAKEVEPSVISPVPFIVYGKGVDSNWFKDAKFGSATQVPATVAEIVGRKGQHYSSVEPSLFEKYPFAFNYRLYVDKTGLHEESSRMPSNYALYIQDLRDVAVWRVVRGNYIE